MNESLGADGNSCTMPTTWNGTIRNWPVRWSSTRSRSRSPRLQRVVGDRLLRDEDAVGRRAQPRERLRGAAAEEVRVAQARRPRERRGVDAEGVLEVGPDVRVGVVDGGDAGDAADARDPLRGAVRARRAGRRGGDDVGAERELRVDARLLVVGRGEDAEVRRRRRAAARRTSRPRLIAAPRRPALASRKPRQVVVARPPATRPREPRERPTAQADQEQRRAEPEQRRRRGTCRPRARASGSSRD